MIRASIIALSLLLASCSSVLTATRDTPIEDNHGTRTFGSTRPGSIRWYPCTSTMPRGLGTSVRPGPTYT